LFNDTGASMAATIGYAVQDDLIVSGTVSNGEAADEDNVYDVTVTYFKNGFGFGATVLNAMEGNGGERTISLSVGKMMMLGAVSDKLYLYPNVSMNKDQQFNSAISFGLKF
jgi:hypothetical protein